MRLFWIVLAGVLAIATGCSKKNAAETSGISEPSASAPARTKPAAAEDGAYDPSVAATVPTSEGGSSAKVARASGASATKNWDAVVAEIVQLRSNRARTDDQSARLNSLQDEIVGAISSDPTAADAYRNLSRIINGR